MRTTRKAIAATGTLGLLLATSLATQDCGGTPSHPAPAASPDGALPASVDGASSTSPDGATTPQYARPTVTLPQPHANGQSLVVSLADTDLASYNSALPASSSDPTYSYELMVAAIAKVQQLQASKLVIPTGTYVFQQPTSLTAGTPEIDFDGLVDVEIDGQGSTIDFADITTGIVFDGTAARVWLHDLTIDWLPLLAFPAHLMLDTSGNPFLQPVAGYTIDASNPPAVTTIIDFDIADRSFVDHPQLIYLTSAHPGDPVPTYSASTGGYSFPASIAKGFKQTLLGVQGNEVDVIATTRTQAQAISIKHQASNITLENLNIYSSPGFTVGATTSGSGIRLTNVHLERNPGDASRMISGDADGFNITCASNVIIEGSVIADNADDGINLHSDLEPVTSATSSGSMTSLTLVKTVAAVGGRLSLISTLDLSTVLQANIVSVSVGANSTTVQIDQPLPAGAPGGADLLVLEDSQLGSNYLVQNNTITDQHGRGIAVHGNSGVVANNQVSNTTLGGIWIGADAGNLLQGPGPTDLLVTGNTVSNPGRVLQPYELSYSACSNAGSNYTPGAAIQVGGELAYANGALSTNVPMTDVTISANTISNCRGLSIQVASVTGATVSQNQISNGNYQAFSATGGVAPCLDPAQGSIMITKAKNVSVTGNKRLDTTTQGLYVDPQTTSGVTAQTTY